MLAAHADRSHSSVNDGKGSSLVCVVSDRLVRIQFIYRSPRRKGESASCNGVDHGNQGINDCALPS
jgi:hypothetical protein